MNILPIPFPVWQLNQSYEVVSLNTPASEVSDNPLNILKNNEVAHLKELLEKNKQENYLCKFEYKWFNWNIWKDSQFIYLSANEVTEYVNSEQYFHQILDAITDMVLVKGKSSSILWANKAFKDHYNMSLEQLKNQVDAPFQEKKNTAQYIIDDAWVWNNKKNLRIEHENVLRHDGINRVFETVKSPIIDDYGEVRMTVGVSRDITDKLIIEQNAIAASKMVTLGEMAGGLAHEMNNPIGVIIAKIDQLLRLEIDPQIKSGLEVISRHTTRISKIVEGLNHFCKGGNQELPDEFPLKSLVDEILIYCSANLENSKIKVFQDFDPELKIYGRRSQISQILLNLINNAISSIEGTEPAWIRITGIENKNDIEIRVQDSGAGVPQELEEKIMQPFFTTKQIGKGMGLGLSISFAIAKLHKGKLVIDRIVSPSCFLIQLPKWK